MKINKYTKISDIIKANELSIEAIASIAKPLRKIRIPLLRKVLTPRVNIEEASKIANVDIQAFKNALLPLGYFWEEQDQKSENYQEKIDVKPNWLANNSGQKSLDVRPLIDTGNDPLKEIFNSYKELPKNGLLTIINSFIPFPLISRLEDKGALSYVEQKELDEYHVYFYKPTEKNSVEKLESMISFVPFEVIEKFISSNKFKVLELDVKELPMPEPMETIMHAIEILGSNEAIYVRHRKIPLYLLEELGNMPYRVFVSELTENDVRILIYP